MNGDGTILAVDDTPESLALLVTTLTTAGHVVRPADSAELALAAVAADPPDLILLDVRMKGMDGIEACRRLKACEQTRHIPIILISAFADVTEWVEGLRLGAVDYINKPFQTAELLSRVKTHLALSRLTVSLDRQDAALRQINAQLKSEVVERQRVEEELRESLDLSTRTARALLSTVEDQQHAEASLRESEKRLTDVIFSTADWVWEMDAHGVEMYSSQKGFDLFGQHREDVIGKTPFDFMAPAEAERVGALFAEIVAAKAPVRDLENWSITNDGQEICLLTNGVPILDEAGNLRGYRGVDKDITDRKRADEARSSLETQLRQAQKMESVGRLAGGVAHDFNNMLGVIVGYTELVLAQVDPASSLYADLVEIHKAATRSADLTRQLLAFARKQTVAPKVLDLNDTVAGMVTMLQRLIGENIEVTWQPGADLWLVNADPSQIDQILANLCVNARDAIAGVGTLAIATGNSAFDELYPAANIEFTPGDYVMLTVSDDGCGMDKDTLSHLFEPFFTTKVMGRGTGLGLSTVYGIVKQNRGFIDVDSEPTLGTTFRVYLPRHVGKVAQTPPERPARAILHGHETILLVEDEPAILKITKRMLEQDGYTVLAAKTPGEATRQAKEYDGEIALLMTDVVMTEMNGRVLAKDLLSVYPRLKSLFMSGYTADVIAQNGVLEAGVQFIQKPFTRENLATKVRDVLDAQD